MSFDSNEAVFVYKGTYLEEQALRYKHDLMEQFAASPEGESLTERGTELGWAGVLIHFAISSFGAAPATMTPSNLAAVVFGLFQRKVITEKGEGQRLSKN
jgi:hypothetical protein